MELEDYLKSLDYKDVDENFRAMPGMAIMEGEDTYYLIGELIVGDSPNYVVNEGCGCCQGTYYPKKYAWAIKELQKVF